MRKSIIATTVSLNIEKEERIVVNPKVMVGKPVIKGTRIPVDAIIRRLAERRSIKEILQVF
ncbi:DUF433 domain-containing protein [Ferroglobus sp.]|uniref:DUF433 domain-containing protein n=1 Tax=Ferroglobus sp. TaxID=2614230 RepID=UPI0025C19E27|nr:DUF433 domain-containing protein [Ferroglobus sp.]